MIRFGYAFCPCCMRKLIYHITGNYFMCDCLGWLRMGYGDRQKELEAAEKYDSRFNRGEFLYGSKVAR